VTAGWCCWQILRQKEKSLICYFRTSIHLAQKFCLSGNSRFEVFFEVFVHPPPGAHPHVMPAKLDGVASGRGCASTTGFTQDNKENDFLNCGRILRLGFFLGVQWLTGFSHPRYSPSHSCTYLPVRYQIFWKIAIQPWHPTGNKG